MILTAPITRPLLMHGTTPQPAISSQYALEVKAKVAISDDKPAERVFREWHRFGRKPAASCGAVSEPAACVGRAADTTDGLANLSDSRCTTGGFDLNRFMLDVR